MRPAVSDPPFNPAPATSESTDLSEPGLPAISPLAQKHEPRNFLVFVLYQIVMRTGWIFKTESIIMPAVLDTIDSSGWLRGWLPMLNRWGHSVPPLLFSRRLKVMSRKKWAMLACTMGMSCTFLMLASMWLPGGRIAPAWMPVLFLVLYTLFFILTGINQLTVSTLQGKLIRPTLRGRLLAVATGIGATCAIVAAWLLLSRWLRPGEGDFHLIFGFAGVCFALAGLAVLLLVEPKDNYQQPSNGIADHFTSAWRIFSSDARFRPLALVAMLFGCSIMLFPHYQALGRSQLDLKLDQLVLWVIVQNAGTILFSLIFGPIADRRGNRLVLRLLMFGLACVPLVALGLSWIPNLGKILFPMVFLLVGMTPIAMKTLQNYTLEISHPAEHPRYLSTMGICMALPIVLSPVVALLIVRIGFTAVFFAIAALIMLGWLMTFRLSEPRHHVTPTVPVPGMTGEE